jgi:predicted PurR-regulated permease PerM
MNESETKQMVPAGWYSQSNIHTLVLLAATVFGIYLCYRLVAPFLSALVWALSLAVLFLPFQRWIESKIKRPGLDALVSVLVIGLMVVVPVMFLAQRLVLQVTAGAQLIEKKVESGEWRRALEAQPSLAPLVDRVGQQLDLPGMIKTLTNWLSNTAGAIVKGSVVQVIGFGLTFYLFFFFLRDRDAALQALRSWSPLTEAEMNQLFERVGDTIYATLYGTLAVSSLQGLLGGLMFWWLGLSSPFFWGVVMALLAVVPVLGAFIVWMPAVFFLVLDGSWGKAVILTLWGIFIVGTIDNLLRPILVGKRLKLHTVVTFMSVVGGLFLFGPAGLILGPVVLTVTLWLLGIWRNRTTPEAAAPAPRASLQQRTHGRRV